MRFFKHLASNIRITQVKQQPLIEGRPADKAPDIRMVITDCYRGAINDVIYMVVRDVDHVMVSILSAEGREVEKGPAVNSSGIWCYWTAIANPTFRGGRVVVTAGNIQGYLTEAGVAVF